MNGAKRQGPVIFDLEERDRPKSTKIKSKPKVTPATAPPVPEPGAPAPTGQAMRTLAGLAARKPSRLARFFWSALVTLVGFVVSVAAWDFVTGLLERNAVLGATALALLAVFILALLLVAAKEVLALGRLRRVDEMRQRADTALSVGDLKAAKSVASRLSRLYANRPDLADGRQALDRRLPETFDADAALSLAERELLSPLDVAATLQVEAAARQVATVTAIVPLALADLVAALTANLRMIRQVAEIYGGRSGTLGSWRLAKAVMTHLVATGAVAVGDDLIGSIAGGGVLSKLSRRFGEGLINGALTARVGVAAIEVCRPLPFLTEKRPSVSGLVTRALAGLVPGKGGKE